MILREELTGGATQLPCGERIPAARYIPPADIQPLQDAALFVVVCHQRPLSLPRTKTSIVPAAGDVAAGDDVRTPPRFSQLDHDVPVYDLWYRAPFMPCTKRSRRPAPHEQAAGPVPAGICPPRELQLDQEAPPFEVVFS